MGRPYDAPDMTPLFAPVWPGSFEPDGERRIDVDSPCPLCGYNLRGLVRGRKCPECGGLEGPAGPAPTPEEQDHQCYACGYDLRGLPRGRRCPECGHGPGDSPRERERDYGDTHSRPLHDAVLAGPLGERRAWRIGLALATACVALAMLARIGYLLATARGVASSLQLGYVLLGGANSIVWIVAVWLVTPASLSKHWRWMAGPRWTARVLSLMWIVGYWCAYARVAAAGAAGGWGAAPVPATVVLGDYGGRLLGGVGAMFVAYILGWVAGEAARIDAARRLNAVVWLLWIPTLLAQAFPGRIAWFTVILLGLVLFFWSWLMALMAMGIGELHQHARWGHKLAPGTGDRAARIERMKRAIDEEVGATVRPLPGPRRDELE